MCDKSKHKRALHYSNPELDLCYNVWSPCLLAGSLHKLDAGVLVELLHGLQDDLCLRLVVAAIQHIRNLTTQMCQAELETKVAEDYAKFYNHGEGPIPYYHCFGIPISCLLTVGVGSTSIQHRVLIVS